MRERGDEAIVTRGVGGEMRESKKMMGEIDQETRKWKERGKMRERLSERGRQRGREREKDRGREREREGALTGSV